MSRYSRQFHKHCVHVAQIKGHPDGFLVHPNTCPQALAYVSDVHTTNQYRCKLLSCLDYLSYQCYLFLLCCVGRGIILANAISTPPVADASRHGGQSVNIISQTHTRENQDGCVMSQPNPKLMTGLAATTARPGRTEPQSQGSARILSWVPGHWAEKKTKSLGMENDHRSPAPA